MLTDRQRDFVAEHLRASHEAVVRASQLLDVDPVAAADCCVRVRKRLATALRTLRSNNATRDTSTTQRTENDT